MNKPTSATERPPTVHSHYPDDPYSDVAEFYDLVGAEVWRRKAPLLGAALSSARPDQGPILDIGAGTGLSTAAIAAALPHASIIAAEPCTPMRIALSSRVATDADLSRRVTVVADSAPEINLPAHLGAVCCLGVVGHLSPEQRTSLWAEIAPRLSTGAPLVIELLEETAPPARRPTRVGRAQAGEQIYEVWSSPETTLDDGVRRWTFTYRVLRDGVRRREVTAPMSWTPVTLDDLTRELSPHGLLARRIGPDLIVARSK